MRLQILLLPVFVLSSMMMLAQSISQIARPNVIPPPPNASAITKGAQLDIGLFTGTGRVTIPLYELKIKEHKLPISLKYSSNGVKVDQLPSAVGIDWALIAGGAITRTILGKDDENTVALLTPPADPYNMVQLAHYMHPLILSNGSGDTQADDFKYSFGEYSGKFYLNETKTPIQLNITNVKIERNNTGNPALWEYKFTTPDGTQYFFGGTNAHEKTKPLDNVEDPDYPYLVHKKVSWYLKKIIYPGSHEINFTYTPYTYQYFSHVYQGIAKKYDNEVIDCSVLLTIPLTSGKRMNVEGVYLSNISSSTGVNIDFSYSPREDIQGEVKLDEMVVTHNGFPEKKFQFVHEYSNASSQFTGDYYNSAFLLYDHKRLWLKEVVAMDVSGTSSHSHKFIYKDINGLPPRLSSSQDHFGYFNGKPNMFWVPQLKMLPDDKSLSTDVVDPLDFSLFQGLGGSKEPDAKFSVKGTLQKVIYPTGGSTVLEWEPNTVHKSVRTFPAVKQETISAVGTGINGQVTVWSQSKQMGFSQYIHIQASTESLSEGTHHTGVTVALVNEVTNVEVYNWHLGPGQTISHEYFGVEGETYKLKLVATSDAIRGTGVIECRPGAIVYQNMEVEVPGLRVKRIVESDGLTENIRRFYYNNKDNLTKSSGTLFSLKYFGKSFIRKYCDITFSDAHYAILEASSLFNQYLTGQNNISYGCVTESFGDNFENGAIEHYFTTATDAPGEVLKGNNIHAAPFANNGYLNGINNKTIHYKNENNQLKPLRKEELIFSTDLRNFSWRNNFVIQKRFYPPEELIYPSGDVRNLEPFDIVMYPRYSFWTHPDQIKTTYYGENGSPTLERTISYTYDNLQHLQFTQQTTTSSSGDVTTLTKKYPQDKITLEAPALSSEASDAIDAMISANIINEVIEEKSVTNGAGFRKRTDFKIWPTSQVLPKTVHVEKTGFGLEPRMQFSGYDEKGNLLGVAKEADVKASYIWGYKKSFAIAEVMNAAPEDIAYTSFEEEAEGGFTIPSTNRSTDNFTGRVSYDLINGAITRTNLAASRQYSVSVWVNGGTIQINGQSPGAALLQKRNWSLYKILVSDVTSVTITGSGLIDELKLYPSKAQMRAYTYDVTAGISSESDDNDRIIYFEYDAFKRLKRIRDIDHNILKVYDYSYANSSIITYYNTSQSKIFKKNTCGCGFEGTDYTYIVPAGIYSSIISVNDANLFAWELIEAQGQSMANTYGSCVPMVCSGPNKKIVNCICETGLKLYVSSSQNQDGTWTCTYKYKWSDGTFSQVYTEISSQDCLNIF